MKLYEIANDIEDLLDSSELTEEETAIILDWMEGSIIAAGENIMKINKNYTAEIDAVGYEISRLQAIQSSLKNKQQRYKDYVSFCMNQMQKDKIKTTLGSVYFMNTSSVNILDESQISDKYSEIVETKKIDKKAIKKAIGAGEIVEGAVLVNNRSLVIREAKGAAGDE